MYYPIQIPFILNEKFLEHIEYSETTISEVSNFIICFWQMINKTNEKKYIKNIIISDGCIDLVVNFKKKFIGFTGMKYTDFDYIIESPNIYFGARLMPGAFYQLTGIVASEAMNNFISIQNIYDDFDIEYFFSLPFENAKQVFIDYFVEKTTGKHADEYTSLFNILNENTPSSVLDLCKNLDISVRKCQRIFEKYFGINPKLALSIIRFQKCLYTLVVKNKNIENIIDANNYYDQSHFINDFKKYMGMTPLQLIEKYR